MADIMPTTPVRILLVEDDHAFADMLEKTLAHAGYSVVRAGNGVEALSFYEAQRPSLVLTDLIMPDMEGIELVVKLRRRDPDAKIVAMSGGGLNSTAAYLSAARLLGATHTLSKPFSDEELFAAIRDALDPRA